MFAPPPFRDYALLDSGEGEKLERFSSVTVRRPDPRALWRRRLDPTPWSSADLSFELDPQSGGRRGHWIARDAGAWDRSWSLRFEADALSVRFAVRPAAFRHLGVFPEQAANWIWLAQLALALGGAPGERSAARLQPAPQELSDSAPKLLNLFGYTGVATLVARRAGFHVTHVDASKAALSALRENLELDGTPTSGVRLLCDDALAFARREVRRGSRYAGILVDPPHHGRGPKGETWQLEEHLAPLVAACGELLAERAFFGLSTYATTTSPLGLASLCAELSGGALETGELGLAEEPLAGAPTRVLPCGACARWTRGLG